MTEVTITSKSVKNIKRRSRTKAMKRLQVITLTFLLMFVLTSWTLSANALGTQNVQYKEVLVQPGDTLWKIASANSANKDIREVIYEIKEINSLSYKVLRSGSVLKIPIYN